MQGRQVLPVSLSVRATVALPRAAVWCGAWGLWAVHRPCHGMCLQVENWQIWQTFPEIREHLNCCTSMRHGLRSRDRYNYGRPEGIERLCPRPAELHLHLRRTSLGLPQRTARAWAKPRGDHEMDRTQDLCDGLERYILTPSVRKKRMC